MRTIPRTDTSISWTNRQNISTWNHKINRWCPRCLLPLCKLAWLNNLSLFNLCLQLRTLVPTSPMDSQEPSYLRMRCKASTCTRIPLSTRTPRNYSLTTITCCNKSTCSDNNSSRITGNQLNNRAISSRKRVSNGARPNAIPTSIWLCILTECNEKSIEK